MRRIVRGVLWVVKGALLAIALGALVLWPWSYRHSGWITLSRIEIGSAKVDGVGYFAGSSEGRIEMGGSREEYAGQSFSYVRDEVAARAGGWKWNAESHMPWAVDDNTVHSWGPLRWNSNSVKEASHLYENHFASFPCWLLTIIAAIWPLTSLTLLYRRRARRRRLARTGCCAKCGYDLRATPQPGGELVTRCPECGTATSAAKVG